MIVVDEKYEDVDSILNWYESKPQKDDSFYFLNLVRFINGLNKVQKHQDVSMIVPYAKSGKRVFKYIVSEADFCNIGQTNYWPILISCAETFNYLNDSIICDIAKFSFHYYRDWNQRDLASLFKVTHNSYQYYCFNGLWTSATEIMECLYSSALEANDTTIIAPASASFIGTAYLKAKDYKNAEQWFSNSYTRFQAFTTKSSYRAYCELLLGMGSLYNQLYKNDVALQYATEACSLNLLNYGTHSKEYIDALALLSNCEIGIGKWDDGLKHLEEAVLLLEYTNNMSNREKQDYKDKLEFLYLRQNKKKNVTSSGNIVTENSIMLEATNDFVQGNFDGCISKFSYLLDLYESNIPNVDIGNFVYVAGSLSNAFISCGEYTRADSVSSKAISLFQESNLESPLIRSLYESKGLLYYTINNVDMALYWYNKAKDMYTSDDERSLQYGLLLSNLAVCQMTKEEYSLAKQLSDKAYEICVQFYGDNSNNANDRLLILNNLATIYTKLKDFSKGKELYERVIEDATSQHNIGAKALALINLSDIYLFYEHDFHKAEEYLREAMKMEAASYVKDIAEMDLLFAQILERRENAVNDIERYNNRIKEELASMYAHFSEVEREEYWTKKSQSLVFLNNLSAVTFNTPHTLKVAYDNAIYTKSMLINSGRLLGQLVNNCNLGIQNEYSSMINMKRRLSDKNCPNDSIDVYREVISQKEKAIVAATPNFSGKLMAQFKTCGAVQRMLSNNEIAIEFIFLPQIKTSFDESELLYGALVLTKNDTVPKLIPLCSEYDLKNLIDSYTPMGQNEIESLYAFSNKTLYHMIWEKLEPYIPKGSTVYYSPTGYISKINLSAISNGNKRLSEICSFHEVSTTASIDEVKQGIGIDYHYAALYGDINYYENVDLMAEKAKAYTLYTSGEVLATRSLNRGTWDLLPGTKEEVETIAELLRNKGTNVYMLTQNDANEESFKTFDANAPALIHIATHGFYFPLGEHVTTSFFSGLHSYTQKDYSMLYSGLLFAGGNNTWTGKKIVKDVEDGILTADEISRLDLSGNKLIVLSACNTGLGDIDNVDGVFGLQRGLKRAGVKTILMSLWKVPDEETKELMTAFYKELLSGQTPYQSLKTAQKQLMDAGKSPYYWAGFMLLD
jgi:tetratricopeptide (TPR) repeat protein